MRSVFDVYPEVEGNVHVDDNQCNMEADETEEVTKAHDKVLAELQ